MRINETNKRSLLKAISFRILEIAIDSVILSVFVTPPTAIGLAAGLETTCLVLYFVFERIWNRINYGREVKSN